MPDLSCLQTQRPLSALTLLLLFIQTKLLFQSLLRPPNSDLEISAEILLSLFSGLSPHWRPAGPPVDRAIPTGLHQVDQEQGA